MRTDGEPAETAAQGAAEEFTETEAQGMPGETERGTRRSPRQHTLHAKRPKTRILNPCRELWEEKSSLASELPGLSFLAF